jgi:hypothetical protein
VPSKRDTGQHLVGDTGGHRVLMLPSRSRPGTADATSPATSGARRSTIGAARRHEGRRSCSMKRQHPAGVHRRW